MTMLRRRFRSVSLALSFSAVISLSSAFAGEIKPSAVVGKPAPAFSVVDAHGKTRSLSEFAGKTVVLEWLNYGCPFVKKHYGSGNMQALQEKYTGKGVVWLSVNSSNKNNSEGYLDAAATLKATDEHHSKASAVLLDTDGKMGRTYGARVTPHMFIIDSKGNLVYAGGIDDKATTEQKDVAGAKKYVANALDEVLAGKPVTQSSTKPYGCGVKYES